MAKNLTLSLDENLLAKARVLAAMQRTTVNAMVRDFLAREVKEARDHDEAREELLKLIDEAGAKASAAGAGRPVEETLDAPRSLRDEIYSGDPRFDRWG